MHCYVKLNEYFYELIIWHNYIRTIRLFTKNIIFHKLINTILSARLCTDISLNYKFNDNYLKSNINLYSLVIWYLNYIHSVRDRKQKKSKLKKMKYLILLYFVIQTVLFIVPITTVPILSAWFETYINLLIIITVSYMCVCVRACARVVFKVIFKMNCHCLTAICNICLFF